MAIEIPGYQPLIQNQVYARDHLKERSLILLDRFKRVSESQVVDYLCKRAEDPSYKTGEDFDLDCRFSRLDPKVIRDLRARDTDCIEFVKRRTPAPAEEQSTYVRAVRRSLSKELAERLGELGMTKTHSDYLWLLEQKSPRISPSWEGILYEWDKRSQLKSLSTIGDAAFLMELVVLQLTPENESLLFDSTYSSLKSAVIPVLDALLLI